MTEYKALLDVEPTSVQKSSKTFANRLNDIIPLLSDSRLDESEKHVKKILKDKILEIVPTKCGLLDPKKSKLRSLENLVDITPFDAIAQKLLYRLDISRRWGKSFIGSAKKLSAGLFNRASELEKN